VKSEKFLTNTQYLLYIWFLSLPVQLIYVGFDVLTAVVMNSSVFGDIMLCSFLKVAGHFRGTRCITCCLLHAGFLLGFCYSPEDGGSMFLQNVD
jgi:hypothetical protein